MVVVLEKLGLEKKTLELLLLRMDGLIFLHVKTNKETPDLLAKRIKL